MDGYIFGAIQITLLVCLIISSLMIYHSKFNDKRNEK